VYTRFSRPFLPRSTLYAVRDGLNGVIHPKTIIRRLPAAYQLGLARQKENVDIFE
jgi:hypothetical protein